MKKVFIVRGKACEDMSCIELTQVMAQYLASIMTDEMLGLIMSQPRDYRMFVIYKGRLCIEYKLSSSLMYIYTDLLTSSTAALNLDSKLMLFSWNTC